MIGVFRDDDLGNQPLGRQPALDQPGRGRRLHNRLLAGAAGVFRAASNDHPILRRDDIEPLRAILANHVHRAATTRAGPVLGLDDEFDPRQMLGERAAAGAALSGTALPQPRVGLLLLGLGGGNRLLEIFQRQAELIGIEPLRVPAELHALQLADQLAQPVVLIGEPGLLRALGIALGPRRQHQRA